MKQFKTILAFEFKNYFKNKIFVGITVFLVAVIAVVMFFPRISAVFSFEETSDDPSILPKMAVVVNDSSLEAVAEDLFSQAFPEYNIAVSDMTAEEIKESIVSGATECAFVLTSPTDYTYYVNNLSLYDMNTEVVNEVLKQLYQTSALLQSGVSPETAVDIMSVEINGTTETLGKDQFENFFYTYIMIFALYMVILLYGQMVATNVATEKSSRAMEVLITSAKPTSMMFGKVIASCLAGLIQLIAVFGSAVLFYQINKEYWDGNMIIQSIFNMPIELLLFMLLFFVLGFAIYAFMFGAVGSTATKLEDVNTSVMPITFVFIFAFIVVMTSMSSGDIDNTVMRVCSYIPFTSPMAMFTRIAMSTVPWYEIVISIGILIAGVVGIGFLAAKIYRAGVVMYGTKPGFKNVLKAVFKS